MQCPKCGEKDTRVVDSRIQKSGTSIRRRRECTACNYRFSTIEEVLRDDLMVVKSDGRREDFDRQKIINGLRRACEKRPINAEQIETIVSDVIAALGSQYENEIPSRAIGEYVMERLRATDHIAYVRFASVYKDFRDIQELEAEIARLRSSL